MSARLQARLCRVLACAALQGKVQSEVSCFITEASTTWLPWNCAALGAAVDSVIMPSPGAPGQVTDQAAGRVKREQHCNSDYEWPRRSADVVSVILSCPAIGDTPVRQRTASVLW